MAKRELSLITIMVVAVTTPTTLALTYYHYTKDPTFRPLSQTIERTLVRTERGPMQVQVSLTLPPELMGTPSEKELTRSISSSFAALGVLPRITTLPQSGPAEVRFIVGQNHFGPYPLARASDGIRAATTAYRINGG